MATTPQTILASIPAGQTLSAPVNLPGVVLGFLFPSNWTNAPASFQTSIQNGPFVELLQGSNNVVIDPEIPSYNAVNKNFWGGITSLIIRSGVEGNETPQEETVLITLLYEPFTLS